MRCLIRDFRPNVTQDWSHGASVWSNKRGPSSRWWRNQTFLLSGLESLFSLASDDFYPLELPLSERTPKNWTRNVMRQQQQLRWTPVGSFNKWLLIGWNKLGDVGQPSNLVSLERQLCAHAFWMYRHRCGCMSAKQLGDNSYGCTHYR